MPENVQSVIYDSIEQKVRDREGGPREGEAMTPQEFTRFLAKVMDDDVVANFIGDNEERKRMIGKVGFRAGKATGLLAREANMHTSSQDLVAHYQKALRESILLPKKDKIGDLSMQERINLFRDKLRSHSS